VGATRVEGVARQPTSGPHVNLCGFSSLLGLETALTMLKTHACEVSGVGALSRMRSVELTVDSYIEKHAPPLSRFRSCERSGIVSRSR
jgi:hypothetical protein